MMFMETTKILMEEHQLILKRLAQLEEILEKNLVENADKLLFFYDFIKTYSDVIHHGKEEGIYFQWISENHPGLRDGPVACMLKEHNIFRALVTDSKSSFLKYLESGNRVDKSDCICKLKDFIQGLRQHISKEDEILYIMAENLNRDLGSGDKEMLEKFIAVDRKYESEISRFKDTLIESC